jgi:hypothetical protein
MIANGELEGIFEEAAASYLDYYPCILWSD